jgi:signal transduction histidine kinase
MKDDFLATVSHELRTPLTSIRSFSEILFDHPDVDEVERARFLGIIVKESERLTRLINQILDLARLESGRMDWRITAVQPREAIEEAIAATSSLFRDNGITLELDLPADLPRIHADRDRLIQVLLNLLSNAVKFCDKPDARVEVSARATEEGLQVSIADNGPGIAPAALERIFEKFQQGEQARGAKVPGTGLGLPICRQIVEYFGGRIWAESDGRHGASFRFVVPAFSDA